MGYKITTVYDIATKNFKNSGSHSSSFTKTAMEKSWTIQPLCEGLDKDPEGLAEQGFAHFTWLQPDMYLW